VAGIPVFGPGVAEPNNERFGASHTDNQATVEESMTMAQPYTLP